MSTQNAELITQLNTLLRLTSHEAATARARVSQATTDSTRKELLENASNCDKRADALRQAVRDLGGAPDVVGIAAGRAAALAKLPLEQAMPITEALLADLALEHQLFDRARLVKVLAADADAPELVALAERLENAHGNTIQWLFTVLSETAIGGPAALAPTGMQTAAAAARTAATFASTAAVTGVNKAVATASSVTDKVQESATSAVSTSAGRIASLASSAKQIARVGRDATLAETEKQAGRELGKDKASSVHKVREHLGAVNASELPIKAFDNLTAKDATSRINRLSTADEVHVVLAYEQAHKKRQAIIDAANKRVRDIVQELVNS
jgi:bacterioferritin (cytochrome b1)